MSTGFRLSRAVLCSLLTAFLFFGNFNDYSLFAQDEDLTTKEFKFEAGDLEKILELYEVEKRVDYVDEEVDDTCEESIPHNEEICGDVDWTETVCEAIPGSDRIVCEDYTDVICRYVTRQFCS